MSAAPFWRSGWCVRTHSVTGEGGVSTRWVRLGHVIFTHHLRDKRWPYPTHPKCRRRGGRRTWRPRNSVGLLAPMVVRAPPPPLQTARMRCRQHFRARRGVGDSRPCVAIVVPFREQREQDRGAQLRKFEQHMAHFLQGARFLVIVVTQSDDRRKFNRGQLLNVGALRRPSALSPRAAQLLRPRLLLTGFVEAQKMAGAALASVIFHDVDLLPPEGLLRYYCEAPEPKRPMHLAGGLGEREGGPISISGSPFAALASPSHAHQVPLHGASTRCPATRRSSLEASPPSTRR